jgi:hypothetical protein
VNEPDTDVLDDDTLEHLLASAGVDLDEAPLGPRAIDAIVDAAIEDGLLPPGSAFDGVDPHQPTWFRSPTGQQILVTLAELIAPDSYSAPAVKAARHILTALRNRLAEHARTPDISAEFDGFDTPAHRAAQAACWHIVHCAVDADTRRAAAIDLANARATAPAMIPAYLTMLTGPCFLPPVIRAVLGPESGEQWAARLNREALAYNHDDAGATIEYPGLRLFAYLTPDGSLALNVYTVDRDPANRDVLPSDLPVELYRDDALVHRHAPAR